MDFKNFLIKKTYCRNIEKERDCEREVERQKEKEKRQEC